MKRKVIYISYIHLTDKVLNDWCINHLIENGITVEYWNLVPLLRGEFNEVGVKLMDFLRTPNTYKEIKSMLLQPDNKDAIYVMLLNFDARLVKLYRLLSQYNCMMVFIAWGALPIKDLAIWYKIQYKLTNPFRLMEGVYNKVKIYIYKKLQFIKPYDVVFAAGQALLSNKFYTHKVVPINLVDYDNYRSSRNVDKRFVSDRYAVFLDVNLPYHTDFKLIGESSIHPKPYYNSLFEFFNIVEKKYGVKVVVAAHPKADYGEKAFQGRMIYTGLTPELVKDADFVISHHSTSISYAVLNHKPIVFIYTDEMAELYKHSIIKYLYDFSEYLDAPIYNINKINQASQIMVSEVNVVNYEKYKHNYIVSYASEKLYTNDIFLQELSSLEKRTG